MTALLHRFRVLPAIATLAWFAAPRIPESVDDVYITADYARTLATTGRLAWPNGERVEGYSSFVSVGLAALLHMLGLAPETALKWIAAVSMVVIAVVADRVFARTWVGTVALFGVLLATPSVRWAVDGMDAPLFALVLSVGWLAMVRGRFGLGFALLGAASLVRPEGTLHWLVAIGICCRERGIKDVARIVFPSAVSFGVYHALRTFWFGDFVATPTLLKVVAVSTSLYGLRQALQDVAPYLGVLVLVAPKSRREWLLGLAPLLLQIAVETRASGDWMSGGRLIMPGAIASAILLGEFAGGEVCDVARRVVAAVLCVVGVLYLPVGWGEIKFAFHSPATMNDVVAGTNRGLVTPLPEDVAWIVEHVPDGKCVLVNDVGMIGGIPGVCVLDMRGLTTRRIAEADVGGKRDETFSELLTSAERPYAVRVAWWGSDSHEVPAWLLGRYAATSELTYPGGVVGWFSDTPDRLPEDFVAKRWAQLARQHTDHPWIAWRAAVAAANAGDLASAHEIAGTASVRWPALDELSDNVSRWSFVSGDVPLKWEAGRGFVVDRDAALVSRPVSCAREILRVTTEAEGASVVVGERPGEGVTTLVGAGETRVSFPGCDDRVVGATSYSVWALGISPSVRVGLAVEAR